MTKITLAKDMDALRREAKETLSQEAEAAEYALVAAEFSSLLAYNATVQEAQRYQSNTSGDFPYLEALRDARIEAGDPSATIADVADDVLAAYPNIRGVRIGIQTQLQIAFEAVDAATTPDEVEDAKDVNWLTV